MYLNNIYLDFGFVFVIIFCKICRHGFEKKQVAMKLVGLILILYFDEDHGSFRIVVGFEK